MARYVYICSAGHSGSTLLDLLIGSHSRIASLGEIWHLSKNLALNTECSCGVAVRDCVVWREVVARVGARLGIDVMADPYALNMGHPKAAVVIDHGHQTPFYLLRRGLVLGLYYLRLRFGARILDPLLRSVEEGISNNFLVFDTVRAVLDADLVVDSSKSYLKGVGLYLRDSRQVRIILLTRDGRGVYWSNLRRKVPRRQVVAAWKNQYVRALPLIRQHVRSEHLLHVKYEDLVSNPVEELKRICRFLGVEYEPGMVDFTAARHHSTNGNDMRLLRSSEIRMDSAWQEQLSEEDLAYFEHRAGALNRQLGYE